MKPSLRKKRNVDPYDYACAYAYAYAYVCAYAYAYIGPFLPDINALMLMLMLMLLLGNSTDQCVRLSWQRNSRSPKKGTF